MTVYASQTQVSADRSRAEIERTLTKYGATKFMYGWDGDRALIGFVASNRQVRFLLPLPDRNDKGFTRTAQGRPRTSNAVEQAYEQAVRQRWRALALVIKAKLEAVETGIVTFEDEFAMFIVLPDGTSVRDHVRPAINEAYSSGTVPDMLALPRGT